MLLLGAVETKGDISDSLKQSLWTFISQKSKDTDFRFLKAKLVDLNSCWFSRSSKKKNKKQRTQFLGCLKQSLWISSPADFLGVKTRGFWGFSDSLKQSLWNLILADFPEVIKEKQKPKKQRRVFRLLKIKLVDLYSCWFSRRKNQSRQFLGCLKQSLWTFIPAGFPEMVENKGDLFQVMDLYSCWFSRYFQNFSVITITYICYFLVFFVSFSCLWLFHGVEGWWDKGFASFFL